MKSPVSFTCLFFQQPFLTHRKSANAFDEGCYSVPCWLRLNLISHFWHLVLSAYSAGRAAVLIGRGALVMKWLFGSVQLLQWRDDDDAAAVTYAAAAASIPQKPLMRCNPDYLH